MSFRVLPQAQDELDVSTDWYDEQTPNLGGKFADAIEVAFRDIRERPQLHPKSQGIKTELEFRFYLLHRFPWIVHYLVATDEILIFAVAHTSRRPDYWRDRIG